MYEVEVSTLLAFLLFYYCFVCYGHEVNFGLHGYGHNLSNQEHMNHIAEGGSAVF